MDLTSLKKNEKPVLGEMISQFPVEELKKSWKKSLRKL